MKYRPLGRSDISVSEICLGTMTWGTQNTEAEGHAQMDYAVSQGVNFFDTAEMYPTTPLSSDTYGRTEEIIGAWFANRGRRDDIVLATKVTGSGSSWIDNGAPITAEKLTRACERSLKRLKTDYIDLYQLHWPNRGSYHFRQAWTYTPSRQEKGIMDAHVGDVLGAAQRLIEAGKIRHVGLSNESAWGVMKFLEGSEKRGLPRVQSIQNEYNLLQRLFDLDLAEVAHHEDVGLLAFSPLAAGFLSGKYRGGAMPEGSRRTINANLSGRVNPHSEPAAEAYFAVADKHGLDMAQMALAFCLMRPFMTSVIIGVTAMEQLRTNVASVDLKLSEDVIADIQTVYRRYPHTM
jgi:aryl-alcohol dehydrogenase-like predicted oxidoreductase